MTCDFLMRMAERASNDGESDGLRPTPSATNAKTPQMTPGSSKKRSASAASSVFGAVASKADQLTIALAENCSKETITRLLERGPNGCLKENRKPLGGKQR